MSYLSLVTPPTLQHYNVSVYTFGFSWKIWKSTTPIATADEILAYLQVYIYIVNFELAIQAVATIFHSHSIFKYNKIILQSIFNQFVVLVFGPL